nr:hypothetical protein [Deltaproteobacteria bacterium]
VGVGVDIGRDVTSARLHLNSYPRISVNLDIPIRICLAAGLGLAIVACEVQTDGRDELEDIVDAEDQDEGDDPRLSQTQIVARANAIKAAHDAHAVIDNPILFAGIASAETGLSHCYDEYTSTKCLGEYTAAACNGGAILAGAWDGTCAQGGLGMFQFDEGTQTQTRDHWLFTGKWPLNAPVTRDVTTLDGNIQASVDFVLWKAWHSGVTPFFASFDDMYAWINGIRPIDGDPDFELWLGFLAHNYNGWGWGTGGWHTSKNKYRTHTLQLYQNLGGFDFWYVDDGIQPTACSPEGGLWCGGNGVGGDPNILYTCDDGAMVVKEVCANGCFAAAAGAPDACNQPNGANTDCSCGGGKYHNGDDIPASATYCGMRVCGLDGNVWECSTANAWQQTGLQCGSGACSCPWGSHLDGTSIPVEHTECNVEVCGGGNTWFTCESGGWEAVSGSYCTMGGGGTPPPTGPSCAGHCGTNAGSCWCDPACANYGDCCHDKVAVCGA